MMLLACGGKTESKDSAVNLTSDTAEQPVENTCVPADGPTSSSEMWSNGEYEAEVSVDDTDSCQRSYTLRSRQPLVESHCMIGTI